MHEDYPKYVRVSTHLSSMLGMFTCTSHKKNFQNLRVTKGKNEANWLIEEREVNRGIKVIVWIVHHIVGDRRPWRLGPISSYAINISRWTVHSDDENSVVVTTAKASHSAIMQKQPISLIMNDKSRVIAPYKFRYRLDPRVTGIEPKNHLIAYVCVQYRYFKFRYWSQFWEENSEMFSNINSVIDMTPFCRFVCLRLQQINISESYNNMLLHRIHNSSRGSDTYL